MHLKTHRWTVYVAHAVSEKAARGVDPSLDGRQLPLGDSDRNVSPVVCFDCGAPAPSEDHCPAPPQPGYPGSGISG